LPHHIIVTNDTGQKTETGIYAFLKTGQYYRH